MNLWDDDAKVWHIIVVAMAIVGFQVILSKWTKQPVDTQEVGSEAGATLLVSA
jgi:hypothetical protein